jgi:torulene dioxygenase
LGSETGYVVLRYLKRTWWRRRQVQSAFLSLYHHEILSPKEAGIHYNAIQTPTFFTFHTINAYNSPSPDDPSKDDVTIDLTCYETNAILDHLYLDHMRSIPSPGQPGIDIPSARRYTLSDITPPPINTEKSTVTYVRVPTPKTITTPPIKEARMEFEISNIELPTIHPRAYSTPYRYAYGTHRAERDAPGVFVDKIVKIDMKTRTWKTWGAEGYTTGEPIFVSRPRSQNHRGTRGEGGRLVKEEDEDDGVVLSVVLDGVQQRSMLVVLDAKDLKEVARAEMDRCVPLGFHGLFMENFGSAEGKINAERARL